MRYRYWLRISIPCVAKTSYSFVTIYIERQMNQHSFCLTLHDTAILKGLAICAMLVHHLFYELPAYGYVVWHCALLGKVCVAIFLFLSGFGLTFQFGKIPIHGMTANSGGGKYCASC